MNLEKSLLVDSQGELGLLKMLYFREIRRGSGGKTLAKRKLATNDPIPDYPMIIDVLTD